MSVYMTISLTVERYMSVCQPLTTIRHRQGWLSTPVLVTPALLLALAITSPNYVLYSYHNIQHGHHDLNETSDQAEDVNKIIEEVGWNYCTNLPNNVDSQIIDFDEDISLDSPADDISSVESPHLEPSGSLIWERENIVTSVLYCCIIILISAGLSAVAPPHIRNSHSNISSLLSQQKDI